MYLNDLKKPKQAVVMFEKCLDIDPSDADAKISLALAFMEIDRIPVAITAFQELLVDSPEDMVVRFNLGNAYLDTAAYSDAVAQYMVRCTLLSLYTQHQQMIFYSNIVPILCLFQCRKY